MCICAHMHMCVNTYLYDGFICARELKHQPRQVKNSIMDEIPPGRNRNFSMPWDLLNRSQIKTLGNFDNLQDLLIELLAMSHWKGGKL